MGRNITKEEYGAIKLLAKTGMSAPAIGKAMNYSESTVYAVLRTDTIEQHIDNNRKRLEKYQQKEKAPAEVVENSTRVDDTISQNHKMPELERIADALEALVEAWNDTKENGKKKGWLK